MRFAQEKNNKALLSATTRTHFQTDLAAILSVYCLGFSFFFFWLIGQYACTQQGSWTL